MKKSIKIIRNYIGKYLLRLLIYTKKFDTFPIFTKFFPKSKYKAIQSLMHRGYLNLAYEIAKNYTPKEHEKLLIEKVLSMHKIKQNGFNINKTTFNAINNLKVLFVTHNSLPYDKAGYAIRTHSIVTKLIKDIDLKVVTRPGYPWDLIKHRNKSYKKQDVIEGIIYERLEDKYKTFKKGSDLNYIYTYAKELEKQIEKYNYTILHANSNYLNGIASIIAANNKKIPIIYEMRGLWYITRTTLDEKFKIEGMYEYEHQMEKACALYADKVVVLSNALKNLLISWGINKEKISIIPNSVNLNKFKPLEKNQKLLEKYNLKNKFIVGFIGSITKYEGLKELIKAIKELHEEGFEDIVLMIIGDGKEKANLEKIINSKNIILTGRVPFEEINKYYSIFDICPFIRNDYEVCRYIPPLKPLEAMAMQKAVIVSNLSPLLEIVDDKETGLVCQVDNIKDIKEKILFLYNNQKEIERLGKNAKNWVEKNRNWDIISNNYIELYNEFK